MLILTRKEGEKIIIYDNIKIVILSNKGGGVRIGIEAPDGIPIHREEVYNRIKQEKEAMYFEPMDID